MGIVQDAVEAIQRALQPQPTMAESFDVVVTRRVSRDCLISFECRRYSVPFAWVQLNVDVWAHSGTWWSGARVGSSPDTNEAPGPGSMVASPSARARTALGLAAPAHGWKLCLRRGKPVPVREAAWPWQLRWRIARTRRWLWPGWTRRGSVPTRPRH